MALDPIAPRPPRVAFALYRRFLLAAMLIVVATSTAASTAMLLEVKTGADILDENSTPIPGIEDANVLDDVDPGGPQTILVLGSDRRYVDIRAKTPARSDTIILVRLDPSRGATSVLSLPRDLRVAIPGYGRGKINSAYELGGPKLTVQTVRTLLGIPINRVVNVNFGGFRGAVDRLGCVYADIDRKYFNDNDPPAGGGGANYAVIDVEAGYQRLCGKAALEYVRYRHEDNDIVRGARQQDFLRQAKAQIGVSEILGDRKEPVRILSQYTQTDIRGTGPILRLFALAAQSAQNPIQEVRIDVRDSPGNVFLIATPQAVRKAARTFMSARASGGPRDDPAESQSKRSRAKRTARRKRPGLPRGLVEQRRAAELQAVPLDTKIRFPVYFPRLAVDGATLRESHHRAYDIFDADRRKHRAYRMVVSAPGAGQNYGVQGTSWKDPPILRDPSEKRSVNGRTLEVFNDGDRLRMVAWRTPRAVYWVSNTLLLTLTRSQMVGLASGLTRVGGR